MQSLFCHSSKQEQGQRTILQNKFFDIEVLPIDRTESGEHDEEVRLSIQTIVLQEALLENLYGLMHNF